MPTAPRAEDVGGIVVDEGQVARSRPVCARAGQVADPATKSLSWAGRRCRGNRRGRALGHSFGSPEEKLASPGRDTGGARETSVEATLPSIARGTSRAEKHRDPRRGSRLTHSGWRAVTLSDATRRRSGTIHLEGSNPGLQDLGQEPVFYGRGRRRGIELRIPADQRCRCQKTTLVKPQS